MPISKQESPRPEAATGQRRWSQPEDPDFRQIFEHAATATAVLDGKLQVVLANPKFRALFAVSADPAAARDAWLQRLPPADREVMERHHRASREDPERRPHTHEIRMNEPEGESVRHLIVSDEVLPDRRRSVVSFIDISQRKNAEAELAATQHRLEANHAELEKLFATVERAKKEWEQSLDRIDDLVILVSGKRRIKRCNKAFSSFTGRSYQELVGWDIVPFLEEFQVSLDDLEPPGVEVYHQATGCWFLVSYYRDQAGDGEGVLVCHEFSEKKRLSLDLEESHRQLKQSRANLEGAFNDLKRTQAQMLQQEKMASLGQLAAGVAHEINNPMGFISSNLASLGKYGRKITRFLTEQERLLAATGLSDMQRESLETLRKDLKIDFVLDDIDGLVEESLEGAERVKKIVQDLKSFSRKDENEYKMADVIQCLESTIGVVRNEIKYKATLEKDYGEVPLTLCRPQALNQVFINLLMNAVQAIAPQGTIGIRVRHEQGAIRVSVSDTGCGIPAENLAHLFDPFFTTKEVGQGTGLGLSVSYDIVKKHGGEIFVDSTLGEGTVFTVVIPVVEGSCDG